MHWLFYNGYTLITEYAPYINRERVISSPYLELVTCSLCQGILWIPKACKNCDAPYCSSCIKNRQAETSQPVQCSKDCSEFIENRCSAPILHILSRLKVKCRNTTYGCQQILSYGSLETHEEECGYRQKRCPGCANDFSKIDFDDHHSKCPLVLLTCPDCNTDFQRKNESEHTAIPCLRIQLRQLQKRVDQLELAQNRNHSR